MTPKPKPLSELPEFKSPELDVRDQKIFVTVNEKSKWKLFKDHHYMNHTLPPASTFYVFYIEQDNIKIPIGCLGMLLQINKIPAKRVTRFVILPEFQGLGFSKRILDGISQYYLNHDFITYIVTFHPRLGRMLENSKNWIPTLNNQKEFATSNTKVNNQECIRSGVKMYRFKYIPQNPPNLKIDIDFMNHNISEEEIIKKAANDSITEYTKNERNKYIRLIREEKEKAEREALLDSQMAPDFKKKKKKPKRNQETIDRLKELKRN